MGDRQREIVDWFDAVYRRRGDAYLRPVRAYLVYPELLAARPGQALLDVACGLGRLLEAAAGYGAELHGVDISRVAVQAARANVPQASIVRANAEALPYADGTFDLVSCIGSLERVIDPARALAEFHRVGGPAARYCIMVRNSETLSWRLRRLVDGGRNAGHANAGTLEHWRSLFEGQGFRVTAVLPDQYPLHRAARRRSLYLRSVDYRRALPGPLERANEFLFLLGKRR